MSMDRQYEQMKQFHVALATFNEHLNRSMRDLSWPGFKRARPDSAHRWTLAELPHPPTLRFQTWRSRGPIQRPHEADR